MQGDFAHYRASWAWTGRAHGMLGQPVRLSEPGAALRAREAAGAEYAGSTRTAVIEAALPVIEASGGPRLPAVHQPARDARSARAAGRRACAARACDYPLLVQGEGSRTELLERFRKLGNAVLLGSQSFWEGVDVRGEALSLVVIDKLPFAPPDDPVLAARIEKMNAEGRNAFMEYQLPQAVITLKQGAGRLIRDETDRGVLMICDPRLISQALRQAHLAQPAADAAHARCGGSRRLFPEHRPGRRLKLRPERGRPASATVTIARVTKAPRSRRLRSRLRGLGRCASIHARAARAAIDQHLFAARSRSTSQIAPGSRIRSSRKPKHWNEVGDEVDRRERVGDDNDQRKRFRVPRGARIAAREPEHERSRASSDCGPGFEPLEHVN